jgi:1-acyl-sn-glycerol-3-phosphate acyltransferase
MVVTLLLWAYFILGHLFFFFPRYLFGWYFSADRAAAFQVLNHQFFKLFFIIVRRLIPSAGFTVDPDIKNIAGGVVICNHISYIDSIWMIANFKRQITIVRSDLFRVPIFGWYLLVSGYIPSRVSTAHADHIFSQMQRLGDFFRRGGILFVFPEGTRSAGCKLRAFNKSAFQIARRHGAPLHVLCVTNTDKVMPPGRYLINSTGRWPVSLKLLESLPGQQTSRLSALQLRNRARKRIAAHNSSPH